MVLGGTKASKYFTFSSTAVGIIAGLGSLYKFHGGAIALGVAAAFAAGGGYFVLRVRRQSAGVHTLLPEPDDEVRPVRNEAELKLISELDQHYFGARSANFAMLRSWWKRYPQGVYILQKSGAVAGAVGIWPLSERMFEEIADGKAEETELATQSVVSARSRRSRRYWYFGDIVMHPDWQGKRLSLRLIEGAARLWLSEGMLAPEVDIVGLGFSNDGEALLRKLNFLQVARSPSGYPVYRRTASPAELLEDLESRIVNPQRE